MTSNCFAHTLPAIVEAGHHSMRRPLSHAVRAALLSLALTGAPDAGAAQPIDTTKTYQIAPAPLGRALVSFAAQSGVVLSFEPALTDGLNSPGLNGVYSPRDGLVKLLEGSGLALVAGNNGSYTLARQAPAASSAPNPTPRPARTAEETSALPTVTVTTTRIATELMQPTHQVTVIDREQLETLRVGADNLASMLAKSVPGLSDSSHTITDFGQTLRGRNVLILVDGIPLNTNRDSSRNLINIDPNRIERIEVLRGSSAVYGSGATGGIIAITTRPATDEERAETRLGLDAALTRLDGAGLGGTAQHYLTGGNERINYELDLGYTRFGGAYDAHGDRIAPDASQGDLFDSDSYSLGGKLAFNLDANQRLQFAATHIRSEQDTDYATDPSVAALPAGSAAARAIKGLELDKQNSVKNTLLSIDYQHQDFWGSRLSSLLYYRDNLTRFTPADVRSNKNRGNNVDQVQQNNKVFGGRFTLETPFDEARDTLLVWGADFIQERSKMPLDVFDPTVYDTSGGLVFDKIKSLTYMPWVTTRSVGAFGQLQHKFNEHWSLEGGLRYERASAWFDDFQPLSQLRVANPATVPGGRISFDAWMSNAGIVFTPIEGQELYASFSQGFDLPDIGLQLRNAQAGFDIHDSQLEPVKTDNYEAGWRGRFDHALATLAVFRSTSDLGAVQSFNNGLNLTRTQERIWGVEGTIDYAGADDLWSVGGSATWMNGREIPQGSDRSQIMTGYRIPPLKLTGYIELRPLPRWSNRLQLTWFGSRDYRLADNKTQFARADVESYHTLDLISRYTFNNQDVLTAGVQNLFNQYYYPLYSQLLRSGSNTGRLPASGAVLEISYTHRW